MAKSSKLQRTLFLYVIPTLVAVFALSFIAATVFGLGLFETPAQLTRMAQGRGAHIVQALVNFALLVAVCICGALLCTENGIKTRRGLIAAAAVSAACAVLMHAMVYGVVWFVPAPYTLLTPDHMTLSLFALLDEAPFALGGEGLGYAAGALIHLFAPQVLLGLGVSAMAARRAASGQTASAGIAPREARRSR
ncbi:MAG TPA: hypothetical protein IAB77_06635 [Candidatus Scatomorpha intestinavium]|uniref:Uncharacterized protein n=1 Tax=Candidatus Scatomorpha intestinavium TaxID=2840922 RepID=A0A9D1CTZ4_9FIRM|nr:hypothetical protein [Candidatus Scatomorpha intestinavium]